MNKFLKGLSMLPFMALAGVTMLSTASAQEAVIKFNKWDNVAGIGDESNFVRIDDQNGPETTEACEDGKTVDVWMYIHNGTSPELNGENYDGPGVAENTVITVDQSPEGASNTHTITGTISADNAPTISDTVTITCGSEEVELKYNGVVRFGATQPDFKLNGDPINGAQVGFDGGRVPGCWDYRATVVVQFEVVNEEEPAEYTLQCQVLNLIPVPGKENAYSINVEASATPPEAAEVSGAVIDITGPNGYAAQFSGLSIPDYTFPEVEGTYNVKATVNFTTNEGYVGATEVTCERNIVITVDEPPVEPPVDPEVPLTDRPRTGAGTNIAMFAAVVIASTLAYRKFVASRQS